MNRPSVDECPDCGETGRYDGRVLINGRGVYRCESGHAWQDVDEAPSEKAAAVRLAEEGK